MIYIAGRRNVNRVKPLVDVQVFSNVEEVILIVNDCQCRKDETRQFESLFVQGGPSQKRKE